MRLLIVTAALLCVAGCDESVTGPSIPLNSEFELQPGQSALVDSASMTVRFNNVSNDSRCPGDAICILGGDAIVNVTAQSQNSTRDYELHTGDMRPVQHDGRTIALLQLTPYPFSARPIQAQDYRATLRVTR